MKILYLVIFIIILGYFINTYRKSKKKIKKKNKKIKKENFSDDKNNKKCIIDRKNVEELLKKINDLAKDIDSHLNN